MNSDFDSLKAAFVRLGKWTFFTLLSLFVLSLFFRRFNGDEGIIGEWAFWLAKNGKAASLLYSDYLGAKAQNITIFHKLYTYILSIIIRVFGFHLFPMRLLSLFAFGGLIYLIQLYLKDKKLNFKPLWFIILLFLIHPLAFNYAFVARPEMLMALLSFAVFLKLYKYVSTRNWKYAAYAGSLAGLSFFTHLNGIAIIAAGGIFLLFYFNWKAVLSYGFSALLLAQLFFLDIPGGYSGFLNDLLVSPDVSKNQFTMIGFLIKILKEHERFFHNAEMAVFSGLFLLVAGFTIKKLWKENRSVLLFFSILVLSLSALTHGKTNKYLLYYLPFMVLIIIHSVNYIVEFRQKKLLIVIVFFGFISAGLSVFSYLSEREYFLNVPNRNQAMASHIPKGKTLLAYDGFVFGQIENYQLRSPIIFFFTHPDFDKNAPDARLEYLAFAKEKNYDYVGIDMLLERDEVRKFIGYEGLNENDTLGDYVLEVKNPDFLIFHISKIGSIH
jgi:hypothetical protein